MNNHKQQSSTGVHGASKSKAVSGPISQVIWGDGELSSFEMVDAEPNTQLDGVLAKSIAVLKKAQSENKLYDEQGKITQYGMDELGRAGFWGVLVPIQYGGYGATFAQFARLVSALGAAGFATEAGIAGMHGCIGAVSSLTRYGTDEQKQRFLPLFAAGHKTSGFALTEPCAGSDLGSLKTVARLEGDEYVINGEKLFNGNCVPGRIIRLVAKVEGEDKIAEFIVELPEENEHFQLVRYKIHAVRQGRNNGLKFVNFRVPAFNRIVVPNGNGLIPIYIGLNYGRVAVGANCAGIMRLLLKSVCPWTNYRETFGKRIETRDKVKSGIARLAALIVGADSLRDWCAEMLDNGERAELECIIAKTFSASALKEAAFDIAMMIHGGRSFLGGHLIGDNVHDYLAPSIYEGQNDMLSMKFFATLAKDHGVKYLLPIGDAIKEVKKGKFASGLTKLCGAGLAYFGWKTCRKLRSFMPEEECPTIAEVESRRLRKHLKFGVNTCVKLSLEISGAMSKHGAKLADEQSLVVHLSQRVQDCILLIVTALQAAKSGDEGTIAAADILCQDLTRKLTGAQPNAKYFRDCARLADLVMEGKFKPLDGTAESPILRQYK